MHEIITKRLNSLNTSWHCKLNVRLFHVYCLLIWANLWFINLIFIFILSSFETNKDGLAEEMLIKVISGITLEQFLCGAQFVWSLWNESAIWSVDWTFYISVRLKEKRSYCRLLSDRQSLHINGPTSVSDFLTSAGLSDDFIFPASRGGRKQLSTSRYLLSLNFINSFQTWLWNYLVKDFTVIIR